MLECATRVLIRSLTMFYHFRMVFSGVREVVIIILSQILLYELLCRIKGVPFLFRCGTTIFKVCNMTFGITALLKKLRKCLHLFFTVL